MNKSHLKIFSFLILCIIFIGLASALRLIHIQFAPHPKVVAPKLDYIPQFVLISFDGSKSIDIWKDIRFLKDEMKASRTPINVTHFMNAAYFLTEETRNLYTSPGQVTGTTNIGVSNGVEDIRARITEVNMAITDGDEIVPHTVGHFSGLLWGKEDWENEFASFNRIVFGLDTIYHDENLPKLHLKEEDIIGFRAPYLDKSPGLYEALHAMQYTYDSSEVGSGDDWPTQDKEGMWHIPLGTLYVGPSRTPVLAMDYNIYVHDTNAEDVLKRGTEEWKRAYKDTLMGWREYFDRNYNGSRAPVLIAYHFGKWNDSLYWEVLKDITRQVCGKLEVRCGTYKELIDYLKEYGVPNNS